MKSVASFTLETHSTVLAECIAETRRTKNNIRIGHFRTHSAYLRYNPPDAVEPQLFTEDKTSLRVLLRFSTVFAVLSLTGFLTVEICVFLLQKLLQLCFVCACARGSGWGVWVFPKSVEKLRKRHLVNSRSSIIGTGLVTDKPFCIRRDCGKKRRLHS